MATYAASELALALDQHIFSSQKNYTGLADDGQTSLNIEESSFYPQESPFVYDETDSGIESSEDADVFTTQAENSKMNKAVLQTPQRASQPASTDSGISMSYDAQVEPYMGTIRDREVPESPLSGKSKVRQRATSNQLSQPLRPAATVIQPMTLTIRPKRDLVPYFAPFANPFTKMRTYINKPLGTGVDDLKEGYIYAFQLDGCPYTKIGKSAVREDKSESESDSEVPKCKTAEASLAERMHEHELNRGPDLKAVFEIKVPFVGRIEKLIHYHLEAGRMKEKCSCTNSKGKPLNHGNHVEWFNNSLDEIWTVATAWKHWIDSMPYVKELEDDTKLLQLSPEWRTRLEEIRGFQPGRDVWLDWLRQHVPEVRKMLIKDSIESDEWIGNKSTAASRASFIRSNAAGVRSEIKRVRTNLL